MRVFQNSGLYPTYKHQLHRRLRGEAGFARRTTAFLDEGFGGLHFLMPVLDHHPDAFFTNGDDEITQSIWAEENGLSRTTDPEDILLAQIENHRTEVFYNLDPARFGSSFVKKLPGHVKVKICWFAAPEGRIDVGQYDAVLNNFPSLLAGWHERGMRAEYFFPAVDAGMDTFASNIHRHVSVAFVGGYSRHHTRRAALIEEVARRLGPAGFDCCLDLSRLVRLAETPLGLLPGLRKHRLPEAVRSVAQAPVFGQDLYSRFSAAKIVLNGAIDMAGGDRGNIRCFEALGCGALLLSDKGRYPAGMEDGNTFIGYDGPDDALAKINTIIENWDEYVPVALRGSRMIRERYSKPAQWNRFCEIVSSI